MKISVVGKEVTGRDLAQMVISLELSDNPFDSCSTIVEAPEVDGLQIETGNQDLIVVAPELEQRQLWLGLFGLRSSNNHEAVRMEPVKRLIIEFGCLHSCTDRDVFQVSQLAFDGSGESGDDDKVSFALLPASRGAAPHARNLWFVPRSKAVDDRNVVHAWWGCNRLLRLVVFRRLQGRWNRGRRSRERADEVWQSSWPITGRGVCAAIDEFANKSLTRSDPFCAIIFAPGS